MFRSSIAFFNAGVYSRYIDNRNPVFGPLLL